MYKVYLNNEVIDELEILSWVKYQKKNDLFLLCEEEEGEGILVGKMIEVENEEGELEEVYSPNAEIYIVQGKPNHKNLEEITIEEV